jgi:hypothetical protein
MGLHQRGKKEGKKKSMGDDEELFTLLHGLDENLGSWKEEQEQERRQQQEEFFGVDGDAVELPDTVSADAVLGGGKPPEREREIPTLLTASGTTWTVGTQKKSSGDFLFSDWINARSLDSDGGFERRFCTLSKDGVLHVKESDAPGAATTTRLKLGKNVAVTDSGPDEVMLKPTSSFLRGAGSGVQLSIEDEMMPDEFEEFAALLRKEF